MPASSLPSDMPYLTPEELSRRWKEEGLRYVSSTNSMIERGHRDGWETISRSEEPQDTRAPLADAVIQAVRHANRDGQIDGLRERFPPDHSPFLAMLKENGQSLPFVLLLDDGRIIMRVGAPYEAGYLVTIRDNKVERLSPEIIAIGRSPSREYFAIARNNGVSIRHQWDGQETAVLAWPTGLEGIPEGFDVQPIGATPIITSLIPFDTGDRALLVSPQGVFVLTQTGANRALPSMEQMREHFAWLQKEFPGDPLTYQLSMEHGAVSPDGQLIAVGHQDSKHYVLEAKSLAIIGTVGPMSEYPHHATFSADGKMIAFNSCHFYNGITIGVPTRLFPGLKTEPYKLDQRVTQLETSCRVYAAVARSDEIIVGDASGYLRAFGMDGHLRWDHFIGSTIGGIDLSRDGKTLVATTYAGFLSIIDLDTGTKDPFLIGTSTHRERRRWLFWKHEEQPLVW